MYRSGRHASKNFLNDLKRQITDSLRALAGALITCSIPTGTDAAAQHHIAALHAAFDTKTTKTWRKFKHHRLC
jgi:hypothetical protein